MLAPQIEWRISGPNGGSDTGFVYVSDDCRVGFCPVRLMSRDYAQPDDNRICIWLARGWDTPTAYQFKKAVDALQQAYPQRGIVIDSEGGLIEVSP